VQIVDSRTGDLQHDYYRPFARQTLRAGLDAAGRLVAWDHALATCSRNAYRLDDRPPSSTEVYGCYVGRVRTAAELDPDLVPTRIPHARLRYAALDTGVPTGAWRAPSHMAVAFAIESHLDELAGLARRNPLDLRLDILGDTADVPPAAEGYTYDPARMRAVMVEAAERGRLGARPAEGRARGFAAHFTFGSYCAHVVEISIEARSRVVVHQVTSIVDCGQPVNLLGIEAQVEGGVVDALGTAFFGEVPIVNGQATVANFDTYRLIRHREAPRRIDVHVIPSRRTPTGMGEIPLPPVAPAVGNAIAALSGTRLRQTPFARDGWSLA
jgi:isoquinoline 1-oxidoreductase beta subunit